MTAALCWQVGDVHITRIEELITDVPAEYLVTGATRDVIDAQRPWIDPFFTADGLLRLSIHSFVVQTPGLALVVDTCVGTHSSRPLVGDDRFLDRVAAAVEGGLESIDVVVCTHLHFDHIGWNTIEGADGERRPAFPNARYLITRAELDELGDDDRELAENSIDPLRSAGQLDAVESGHSICPEVSLLPTPGHTPGHVSVLIESHGDVALITGDAAHSPVQFTHPDLAATRFDADSKASTTTRRELVSRFVGSDALVLGTHFAPPTAGRIRRATGGDVWFDCEL